jgi:drug/metabolite transporter (DMT)-like permease
MMKGNCNFPKPSHPFCKRISGFLNPESAMSKATSNQTKSDNVPAESEDEARRKRKSPFLHPYLQLFISIILTAASQIFLKIGVDTELVSPWYAISNFFAYWIWLGILAVIGSLFSWLYALKSVPLIIAFNLAATNHIMVAVGSRLFLGEAISSRRWIGVFLVAVGVFFIARPAARAEEKL